MTRKNTRGKRKCVTNESGGLSSAVAGCDAEVPQGSPPQYIVCANNQCGRLVAGESGAAAGLKEAVFGKKDRKSTPPLCRECREQAIRLQMREPEPAVITHAFGRDVSGQRKRVGLMGRLAGEG